MSYKGRAPFQSAAFTETQRNFTYFDKSLTSGLTDVMIESPGDFLYIDQASTGVVQIELNMRQGGSLAPITLAAGGSIECDFSSVKITADAQLNKSVRIVIGNGARIKGGANVNAASMSVSVVDGGPFRTKDNKAFLSFIEQTAVAGQYSHIQLYNPTGSGKNAYVKKMLISPASSSGFILRQYDTALANAYDYLHPASKSLGNSASVLEQRTETFVGVAGSTSYLAGTNVSSNHVLFDLTEPILVQPGKGLLVFGTAPNTRFSMTSEFIEE
mgnify:CR=1 FL=1